MNRKKVGSEERFPPNETTDETMFAVFFMFQFTTGYVLIHCVIFLQYVVPLSAAVNRKTIKHTVSFSHFTHCIHVSYNGLTAMLNSFATAQRLIQGKWTILILHHLSSGATRFNELQRKMPKMTHATLSKQLKQLESEGLIVRTEYPQIPPKVEYSLSEIGKKFAPVLESIKIWGLEYISYMQAK